MNKKQLVAKLSGSLNLSKADAERTFDTITNTILDALKNDDSVKIAGFGTYKVAKRKARVGRNPRISTNSCFSFCYFVSTKTSDFNAIIIFKSVQNSVGNCIKSSFSICFA